MHRGGSSTGRPERRSVEKLYIGQEVIGKFRYGAGKGMRTSLAFPHGHITKITENGFEVDFPEIKGGWKYKNSDIGKIVYLKESDVEKSEEQQDHQLEMERLGLGE